MAMALAAVVMAGVTVSCDPMDKDDDQQNEQTGGDQTGDKNDDNVAFPTPEGKMWAYDAQNGSPLVIYDFGVTETGKLYDGWYQMGMGVNSTCSSYVFDATDATSGTVTLGGDYYHGAEIAYRNLTATTVEFDQEMLGYTPGEFVLLTVFEETITEWN